MAERGSKADAGLEKQGNVRENSAHFLSKPLQIKREMHNLSEADGSMI